MFLWDEANILHISKHDVLPSEAEQVIENTPLDLDRQIRNSEERMVHVGETNSARILVVVTTMRGELIRVVTAFDADRKLRRFYTTKKGIQSVQGTRDP